MFEVIYYKRLESRWVEARVCNLTHMQAIAYYDLINELFDPIFIKIREMN
jgi:hypothetical protein